MDQFDRAQELDSFSLQQNLAAQRKRSGENAGLMGTTHCIDCSIPIPLARRDAHPGCVRCVVCQERHEQEGF